MVALMALAGSAVHRSSRATTPLVELVGLRANIFLLPFLLLGTRLSTRTICSGMALGARRRSTWPSCRRRRRRVLRRHPAVLSAERSHRHHLQEQGPGRTNGAPDSCDLLERARLCRNDGDDAAAAGRRLVADPIGSRWHGRCSAVAIVASLLGVFMAAARTHMITAVLLVSVVTISGRLAGRQWVRWVIAHRARRLSDRRRRAAPAIHDAAGHRTSLRSGGPGA